jgi:hypothetical protein
MVKPPLYVILFIDTKIIVFLVSGKSQDNLKKDKKNIKIGVGITLH